MVIRGVRIFFYSCLGYSARRGKSTHLQPFLHATSHHACGGHPIRALLHARTPVVGCPAGRLIALPLSSKRLLTHLRTHETESRFFAKSGHVHRAHAGLRARARTPSPPPYPWLSACQARGRLTPYSTPSTLPHTAPHTKPRSGTLTRGITHL